MKEKILAQEISQELKQAYLDYAMSVIVARALPDVRDGLKPVQRRILYVMKELSLWPNEKFTKCANIVGSVIARYHPHGDQAVYDALVRLAQDFSLRYPLVQGQGNFGSLDGDPPAAYRYTEAKLSQIAIELLTDIDKETVDFRPNYDNTKEEPAVLPARFPNLIVNGALGIAVGMATNIPTHNLIEIMSAVKFLIKKPEATTEEILQFIKGPDFPTGGVIYGAKKLKEIYKQGRGGIILAGEIEIEKTKRERLIIISIPWQVNKAELIKEIANLALEKVLAEIKDVRDESSKEGIRIVVETRPGTDLEKLKNRLYQLTALKKTFYFNLIALENGIQPKLFSLKEILLNWIEHRREVIRRRTKFDLEKNKERVHLLEGFDKALENLDKVINIIKRSEDKKSALANLMKTFKLSEKQADAILEMPLRTLTRMERHKILDELKERRSLIQELEEILRSSKRIDEIITQEADEIIKKYPSERLTKIALEDLEKEKVEKIEEKDVWLYLDRKNFVSLIDIDRLNLEKLIKQGLPKLLVNVSTKDTLLALSRKGKVYTLPLSNFYYQNKYLESKLNLDKDDEISKVLILKEKPEKYLVLITQKGLGKKIEVKEILSQRRTGVQAIKLKDDLLVDGHLIRGEEIIGCLSQDGNILMFKENLPIQGKSAKGVKVIKGEITRSFIKKSDILMMIFEQGYYKKIDLKEIKLQRRGTKGVRVFEPERYGQLLDVRTLTEEKEIFLSDGALKKIEIRKLSLIKRTQVAKKIEDLEKINSLFYL